MKNNQIHTIHVVGSFESLWFRLFILCLTFIDQTITFQITFMFIEIYDRLVHRMNSDFQELFLILYIYIYVHHMHNQGKKYEIVKQCQLMGYSVSLIWIMLLLRTVISRCIC